MSVIDFNFLEQIATLVWASTGDSQMAEQLAAVKLVNELWERFSGEKELEALRTETILKISKFVNEHPNMPKEELSKEVTKLINEFASKVEKM
ncbi:hypothetical protein Bpfe_023754 [Biomphalaria pfeifferi]|uniref:Uncharacterized protein n=1 Tax=Biomphalaria pfeifferi TaxID=112525 RepID=A0AAD8B2L9_BIOPF|nr:hypothetical protein Bpfe_023754 [Biomphalaria pfeifferi]